MTTLIGEDPENHKNADFTYNCLGLGSLKNVYVK